MLLNKNFDDDDCDWFWISCCRTFFSDITFFQSLDDCLNGLEIAVWNFLGGEEAFLWFSFIWITELRSTFFASRWRRDQRWDKWAREELFFELWFICFDWIWRRIRYRFAWREQKQRSNNQIDDSTTSASIKRKILFDSLKIRSTTFKFRLEIWSEQMKTRINSFLLFELLALTVRAPSENFRSWWDRIDFWCRFWSRRCLLIIK